MIESWIINYWKLYYNKLIGLITLFIVKKILVLFVIN